MNTQKFYYYDDHYNIDTIYEFEKLEDISSPDKALKKYDIGKTQLLGGTYAVVYNNCLYFHENGYTVLYKYNLADEKLENKSFED